MVTPFTESVPHKILINANKSADWIHWQRKHMQYCALKCASMSTELETCFICWLIKLKNVVFFSRLNYYINWIASECRKLFIELTSNDWLNKNYRTTHIHTDEPHIHNHNHRYTHTHIHAQLNLSLGCFIGLLITIDELALRIFWSHFKETRNFFLFLSTEKNQQHKQHMIDTVARLASRL